MTVESKIDVRILLGNLGFNAALNILSALAPFGPFALSRVWRQQLVFLSTITTLEIGVITGSLPVHALQLLDSRTKSALDTIKKGAPANSSMVLVDAFEIIMGRKVRSSRSSQSRHLLTELVGYDLCLHKDKDTLAALTYLRKPRAAIERSKLVRAIGALDVSAPMGLGGSMSGVFRGLETLFTVLLSMRQTAHETEALLVQSAIMLKYRLFFHFVDPEALNELRSYLQQLSLAAQERAGNGTVNHLNEFLEDLNNSVHADRFASLI